MSKKKGHTQERGLDYRGLGLDAEADSCQHINCQFYAATEKRLIVGAYRRHELRSGAHQAHFTADGKECPLCKLLISNGTWHLNDKGGLESRALDMETKRRVRVVPGRFNRRPAPPPAAGTPPARGTKRTATEAEISFVEPPPKRPTGPFTCRHWHCPQLSIEFPTMSSLLQHEGILAIHHLEPQRGTCRICESVTSLDLWDVNMMPIVSTQDSGLLMKKLTELRRTLDAETSATLEATKKHRESNALLFASLRQMDTRLSTLVTSLRADIAMAKDKIIGELVTEAPR